MLADIYRQQAHQVGKVQLKKASNITMLAGMKQCFLCGAIDHGIRSYHHIGSDFFNVPKPIYLRTSRIALLRLDNYIFEYLRTKQVAISIYPTFVWCGKFLECPG